MPSFSPQERKVGGTMVSSGFRASLGSRGKAVELQQMLQILGKQAARKDIKSTWEREGLEKILAPFGDLPLGLVCWRADEPRYQITWLSHGSILTWCLCRYPQGPIFAQTSLTSPGVYLQSRV